MQVCAPSPRPGHLNRPHTCVCIGPFPQLLHPDPSFSQVIQHGACLGLGIAALGTEDEEAFEDIKNVLYMDNAGRLLFAASGRV